MESASRIRSKRISFSFFRNFVFGRTRFRYVLAVVVVVIIAVVVVGFVVVAVVVAAASALLLHLKRCLQNAFGLL